MPILVDTGPIFALADRDDRAHIEVKRFFESNQDLLIVPVMVVPEASYLMSKYLGGGAVRSLARSLALRELRVEAATPADFDRITELLTQYADSRLDMVDASVIALAERLHIVQVLTLDRRDFTMVRPRHCTALELLP